MPLAVGLPFSVPSDSKENAEAEADNLFYFIFFSQQMRFFFFLLSFLPLSYSTWSTSALERELQSASAVIPPALLEKYMRPSFTGETKSGFRQTFLLAAVQSVNAILFASLESFDFL